jgi:ABC-type uncharacterized transport system permease subunit
MHNINKSELISKVLINVLFISLFIGFFFFTYGTYIEKKVVTEQMNFLSKDIKNFFSLFGKNINDTITTKLNKMILPDLSHEDKIARENNNKIKKQAFIVLLVLTLFILFIVYYNYTKYGNNNYKLNEIISENIVILIAIGLTEFVFLTYFGARFISINPNIVKLTILESLREKNII